MACTPGAVRCESSGEANAIDGGAEMTRELDRTKYIGGPDAAAIVGCNPWRTPFQVWAEKAGQAAPLEVNKRMRWGQVFEEPIAQEWAARHGKRFGPQGFFLDSKVPYFGGHPDRIVGDPAEGILEIKTVGGRGAALWQDPEPPEHVLVQVHWYLRLVQVPVAWVFAVVDNEDVEFQVQADAELEAGIADKCEQFWVDHVLTGKPPPVDSSEAARDWLAKRAAKAKKTPRVATPAEAQALDDFRDICEALETEKERYEFTANRIKELIASDYGIAWNRGRVTFSANKDSERTDWEALAQALLKGMPPEEAFRLVKGHTRTVPGAAVLRKTFTEERTV